MKVAIVQIARCGDIVNLLPVAHHMAQCGHSVDWYVHRDFAPILEAVSYVRPMIVDGSHNAVKDAYDLATTCGYDRVYDTQVNGAFRTSPGPRVKNFALEPWQRAGYLDLYHDLPLIFDRRDPDGERQAIERLLPERDGKPILALALHGFSSRFADLDPFIDWLDAEFSDFQLLDLCGEPLPKVHYVLGPLSITDAAIAIDSAPLHLTYATRTPVIALQPHLTPGGQQAGSEWFRSERRRHWLGAFTYEQANEPWARRQIAGLIRQSIQPAAKPAPIIHIAYGGSESPNARRREEKARRSFETIARSDPAWRSIWADESDGLTHLSDDPHKLPFVGDLMDRAAALCPQDGIIVLTNADVCLSREGPELIRSHVQRYGCCYSARVNVGRRDRVGHIGGQYNGTDLFACTPAFWHGIRDQFPPMVIGREGWDFILRHLFRSRGGDVEIQPPILSHEQHDPFWATNPDDPGQRHNRRVGEAWARGSGMEGQLALPNWLFK